MLRVRRTYRESHKRVHRCFRAVCTSLVDIHEVIPVVFITPASSTVFRY